MTKWENLPAPLKVLRQWVCVRSDSKIPMQALRPEPASASDPDTWSSYEDARQAVEAGHYDGVGFVFREGGGLVGLDIDAAFEDRLLTPLGAELILACKSYTERSRSGRGLHILLSGELPFHGRNNRQGVEIYRSRRYFILTGDVMFYRKISGNQPAIERILERHFPELESSGNLSASERQPRIYAPEYPPPGQRIPLRPRYPPIPAGGRNLSLASLAGSLHAAGWSRQQIFAELLRVNAACCLPPLPRREVESVVRSITRYPRR